MRATILAVDDDEDVRNLVGITLGKEHTLRLAPDAATALKLAFEQPPPDLIMLDVEMPDVSGYELCKTLKGSPAVADIPVVFFTSRAETRDVVQGFQLGALDYIVKPLSPPVLAARVRTHLELIERRNKQDDIIRDKSTQLEQTRLELIRRLGRAMEYHETSAVGNRVIRLGHYARALSMAAGARPILADMMMKAAPLHDIGKVGVPAAVLRKSGALTVPEREQMQRHPEIGAEIIGVHEDPLLKLARTLAFTHHERWDGSGYPQRAAGNDIPWAGRVMAIVDAFESMTVTQFHREPRPPDLAGDEIIKGAGKQFDPAMVAAFKKALPEFRRILATYADQLGDMLNLDFSSGPTTQDKAAVDEKQALEARAAEQLRQADAARAKAFADAQTRLKTERELAAAAQKDIVTQHDARRQAEERATREAELMDAAKNRAAQETTALRLARHRTDADIKAANIAQQRAEAEEAAAKAAVERAEAEAKAIDAAKLRAEAEKTAEGASALRAQAEKALGALLEEKAGLEAEIAALGAENKARAEAASAQQAEIDAVQVAVEALRQTLVQEKAQRAQPAPFTPSTLPALLEEKAGLESEVAALSAENKARAEAAGEHQAEIDAAQAAVEALRQNLVQEKAQLAQPVPFAAAGSLAALLEEKARLRQKLDALVAERSAAEQAATAENAAQVSVTEGDLEDLRAALSREKVLLAAAQEQSGSVAEDPAVAEKRRLEDELERAAAERKTLEDGVARAATERAEAEAALEGLREKLNLEQELLAQAVQVAPDAAATAEAERGRLEEAISAAAVEREQLEAQTAEQRSAHDTALEGLRQSLARAETEVAAARARVPQEARESGAERARLRDAIAAAAAEREALEAAAKAATEQRIAAEAELDALRQTVAREAEAVAASRKQVQDIGDAHSAVTAQKSELEEKRPLIIGPPPQPVRRGAGAAFAAFILGAAIASAAWHVLQPEEVPSPPPPPAPQAKAISPAPAQIDEPTGEPLKLRLDSELRQK